MRGGHPKEGASKQEGSERGRTNRVSKWNTTRNRKRGGLSRTTFTLGNHGFPAGARVLGWPCPLSGPGMRHGAWRCATLRSWRSIAENKQEGLSWGSGGPEFRQHPQLYKMDISVRQRRTPRSPGRELSFRAEKMPRRRVSYILVIRLS